jgi:phospholipase C
MDYPVFLPATADRDGILTLPFRPALGGLVNVVATASGVPPATDGDSGGPDGQPLTPGGGATTPASAKGFYVGLRLDVHKPGEADPVATQTVTKFVPLSQQRGQFDVLAMINTVATDADLAADWTVNVTNLSAAAAHFKVWVRYQAVAGNLGKIDHLVVLMLENRSFDHMLGYLSLGGRTDVNGLAPGMANFDTAHNKYAIHPLATDGRPNPTYFANDPGHGWDDVLCQLTQLSPPLPAPIELNTGFVQNFIDQLARDSSPVKEPPGAIMGYYTAAELPVYDMLAREFVVCDSWFASIPTDTWPNRLYAMTGGTDIDTTPSGSGVLTNPPSLSRKTVFEVLEEHGVTWKIYFSDIPFALALDHLAQDATYTQKMRFIQDFFVAAESGDLPAVTWLDPRFTDVEAGGFGINDAASDDHPPGDVRRGQLLVKQIYDALARSPVWSKTLFIVTYDEHGGFYDHVTPPGTSTDTDVPAAGGPADDTARYRRYGVRVPTLLISPWVATGGVAKDQFDHTSLIATMLRRFCLDANGQPPPFGQRTDNANDVGRTLTVGTLPVAIPATPNVPAAEQPPSDVVAPEGFGAVLRMSLVGF